jgi:hypothetical protein
MKLYQLKNKKAPWGDYGELLLAGMTMHKERKNGLLQVERTGPYVPPMIVSGLWDIIVTDKIKAELDLAGLQGIKFAPTLKTRIVLIDWTTWNFENDEPLFYPDSGEPEDYILGKPHSAELSGQIGLLWELVIHKSGHYSDNGDFTPGPLSFDIFMPENRGYIFATEKAKQWIEQYAGDWVTLDPLK